MRWREEECGPVYGEDDQRMERRGWRPSWPETRERAEQLRRQAHAADGGEAAWRRRRHQRRVSRHRNIGRGYRPGSRGRGVSMPTRWLATERRFAEDQPAGGEYGSRGSRYRTGGGEYGSRRGENWPGGEYAPAADYALDYDQPARRRSARWRSRLAEWYDEEFRREPRRQRREGRPLFPEELIERYRPHKAVGGFSARGIHTYDLDYGRQAGGPTTEYSGRAGLPTNEPGRAEDVPLESEEPAEWPYTPGPVENEEAFTRLRPRYEEWHWSTAEPASRRPRRGRRRSDRG